MNLNSKGKYCVEVGLSIACRLLLVGLSASPCALRSQSPSLDEPLGKVVVANAPDPKTAPQVKLRLSETVSSANAKVGQVVLFEVVDPVEVDGQVVVAAGAHARALVTAARRRGHNGREGKVLLTVQSVTEANGSEGLLQSAILKKGTGRGEPIFGPCTFPIPADPVGLFRKGSDVVIPKGTALVAFLVAGAP